MIKFLFAVLAVGATLTGCAVDTTPPPEPTIHGSWLYSYPNGRGATGLSFNENGTFVQLYLSVTSSSTANVEKWVGTYTATADTVSFTPRESTCANASSDVWSPNYAVDTKNLTLSDPDGIVKYERLETSDSSSGIQLTYGCFDRDGNFARSSLTPIQ